MPQVIDAGVDTKSQRPEERILALLLDEVQDHVERSRPRPSLYFRLTTTTTTSTPDFAEAATAFSVMNHPPRKFDPDDITPWEALRKWLVPRSPLHTLTQATSPTSTTVSSIRSLLRARHRDDRLARMTPERRATYERIKKLRDSIGPIDFDLLEALREIREHG